MAERHRAITCVVTWDDPDPTFAPFEIQFQVRLRTKDANGNWQWRYDSGILSGYSDNGGNGWTIQTTVEWDDANGQDDIKCYVTVFQVEIQDSMGQDYLVDHPNVFETITANSQEDFTSHLSDWSISTEV